MNELEPQDCAITVYHGEDWNDAFFLMDGTRPLDLTTKTVELHIRPAFDHPTLIRKLTSAGSGEIIIDNAALGAAHIFMPKATVASALPVGAWVQFLRVVDLGGTYDVLWRGEMIIRAGRDS